MSETSHRPSPAASRGARLFTRGLLVPGAFVIAALVAWHSAHVLATAEYVIAGVESWGPPDWPEDCHVGVGRPPLSDEQRFLLFGGPALRSTGERAIWEATPTSKVYFGNYISHLTGDYTESVRGITLDKVIEELERGRELDSGNGRYPFLLGALQAEEASELQERPDGDHKAPRQLIVADRPLLDKAMALVLEASETPAWKTYTADMLRERFQALGPIRDVSDHLFRFDYCAHTLLTDVYHHQHIARILPRYAELLVAEGRTDEAIRFADAWLPLVSKWHDDAYCLIESLVAFGACKIGSEGAARVHESLGNPAKAAEARLWKKQICGVDDAYQARKFGEPGERLWALGLRSISLLDRSLSVVVDPDVVLASDLAWGRRLEHVILEQVALGFGLLLLAVMVIGCFLSAAYCLLWTGFRTRAPLFVPSFREAARMLFTAVLLPLVAFYAYTRYSGLAGRDRSMGYLGHRFMLELLVLFLTIVSLLHCHVIRIVRRRFIAMDIPLPKRYPVVLRCAPWLVLIASALFCVTLSGGPFRGHIAYTTLKWIILHLVLSLALFMGIRWAFGFASTARYRGSIARALIPVYATATILIAAIGYPTLRSEERSLLQNAHSLTGERGLAGFYDPEAVMVQEIKAAVREIAKEMQKRGEDDHDRRSE